MHGFPHFQGDCTGLSQAIRTVCGGRHPCFRPLEILTCVEGFKSDLSRVRLVMGTSFASHLDIVVKESATFSYDTRSLQPEETIIHLFHMIRDHCSLKRQSSTRVMADRRKEVGGKHCKTQFSLWRSVWLSSQNPPSNTTSVNGTSH